MRRCAPASILLALALASLTGCAGYTQNVRATRAFLYEEPNLAVAADRAEDLDALTALVDKLLLSTPYTPGDAWVAGLAPSAAEFARQKAELRARPPYDDVAFEVPVAKVYRAHLEHALSTAPEKGKYASLLEAMGELSGAPELGAHWEAHGQKIKAYLEADDAFEQAYARAFPRGNPSPVASSEPDSVKVAREARGAAKEELDAAEEALNKDLRALDGATRGSPKQAKELTRAVSVAYRANLEALAIVPVVLVQAVRATRDLVKGGGGRRASEAGTGAAKLAELPAHVEAARSRMVRQTKVLEAMTRALARIDRQELEQTPGFELKESVVDQVVGVTKDSFRVNLRAGGEAFIFSTVSNQYDPNKQRESGQQAKEIKDYRGRLRGLKYDVKPIMLLAARLDVGFDYIKLPNAGNLSLGVKTDRGVSSGGSVDNQGSFAQQVGATGAASDALDLGLGLLGVKTSVRVANFTAGKVSYVGFNPDGTEGGTVTDAAGRPVEAPLQLQFRQIDVGYDLAFLMGESASKYYIEELTVGGKYYEYALPRVLYELESTDPPNAETKTYRYFNESAPQLITSKYYLAGATIRAASPPSDAFGWFLDLGVYVGVGPTSFYMRRNRPSAQTVDQDTRLSDGARQELREKSARAANATLGLGARYRFSNPKSRLKVSGEALYRAELIYAQTEGESGASASSNGATPGSTHIVDFGTTDVFHGPRFNLVGEF